ncbi:MAG: NERD domain-containing protein [Clostridia bacterium]|nr:NERD domain-containing protein [Clostridia bacterium]
MGFFDRLKEPVFLKDSSNAEQELAQLKELRSSVPQDVTEELDLRIRLVEAGIHGESTIRFELANSHIPMYVLHDLYLEHEGLSAQIDYLLVTKKAIFVLECKNLQGNIEINSSGDFIRTLTYGTRTKKEGIYSPITQNRRHLELIKQIRSAEKTNPLFKMMFERGFYQNYRSVVVLSNPKTLLNARYAKKEIRQQVIRADQLAEYIRAACADPSAPSFSDKDMEELAQFFLNRHKDQAKDYTTPFREAMSATQAKEPTPLPNAATSAPQPSVNQTSADQGQVLCPKCGAPMIRRIASKGSNAGNAFYGCSKFPACRCIVPIKPD